ADRLEQLALGGPKTQSKFWKVLVIGLWAASLAILLSALVGYVALAEFLSQQLVFGVIVVLTAWLLLRFIDYIFLHLTADDEVEWGGEAAVSGSGGQAAILGSGVLKLFVYVAASVLLMLPWGYRTSDFFQIFQQAFFGFEVGGLSISISTILLALALFMIGYTVTVALRGWLNNKLLPTTSLDIGISNSISTVFGYIGVLVAAMLAISAAGFDLSNLAIVAGALSVGIGFGLQSIVSNFVSGLILLAERPIKAGDWVSTSGGDGYVRKISVRSTEIETFDRATVIVPNSSLITETVTNWTHGSKIGRIIIPIGVAYNSDPEQVQAILLQCAKDHKLVLGRPEPVVYFMDFGASSLDFQLRCFLSDINYGIVVQSELRFAILKALREAKIEIPFPQREVLVKNAEAETPFKPRRSRKAAPKAAD
ncbi:MAG: mechanosensitive ion channel domain-containing protein, partial [Pseudomonadota bacterium]